jgi:hypothetical protein
MACESGRPFVVGIPEQEAREMATMPAAKEVIQTALVIDG